jgi:hypothetical protein
MENEHNGWPSLVSRLLPTPPVRFSVVSLSPFRYSRRFPSVSRRSIFMFSAPIINFCLPSNRQLPWKWSASPQLQHVDFLAFLRRVGSDRLSQNVPALVLCYPAARSTACRSRARRRASFTVFSLPSSSWILMSGFSTPSANALPASRLRCSSGSVG